MDSIQSEIDAVTDGLCNNAKDQLIDYLENVKMAEVGGDTVTYGPSFGGIVFPSGNISDWSIDATSVPIYEYLGVGWDGDAKITQLITDYAFGNDYITRPVTGGATYGLKPNWDLVDKGKSILEENKTKIDESISVLSRYGT